MTKVTYMVTDNFTSIEVRNYAEAVELAQMIHGSFKPIYTEVIEPLSELDERLARIRIYGR